MNNHEGCGAIILKKEDALQRISILSDYCYHHSKNLPSFLLPCSIPFRVFLKEFVWVMVIHEFFFVYAPKIMNHTSDWISPMP